MDTEQLFYTQNGYDRADTGPLTTAMEDYLEMICRLTRTGGYTRISALARELHVQPSSASKMAALLRSGGYLTNERYGCLRLTEKGRGMAQQVHEKQMFFERWLVQAGVAPACARADACRIKHAVSEESYVRLRAAGQKEGESKC